MKFGTFFFFQWPPGHSQEQVIRNEMEQMLWSEALGFDHIWITEHHFIDYGLSVDPPMIAATIAGQTSRIRIGLAAAILPFHNPIRLAEQLALADIISNGRLDVGIGRGNRPAEFSGYTVPQIEARDRFDEIEEILIRAWTQDSFSYEGKHFKIPEVRVIPKPQQKPHPPMYVVCVSPGAIEATARKGYGMLNSVLFGSPDQLTSNRDVYVNALRASGGDDAAVAAALEKWGVSRHIYVADTDEQALAEAKDAEMWYQTALRRFMLPDRIEDADPVLQPGFRAIEKRLAEITWESLVEETLIFGSPETVSRHIEKMRDMGVGHVMCWMNFGGLPQDKVRRSMELFSREVMPNFR